MASGSTAPTLGSVRLTGGQLAGGPATLRNHCSRLATTVFFSPAEQAARQGDKQMRTSRTSGCFRPIQSKPQL